MKWIVKKIADGKEGEEWIKCCSAWEECDDCNEKNVKYLIVKWVGETNNGMDILS